LNSQLNRYYENINFDLTNNINEMNY